jgi:hypothetical protein
MPITIKRLPYGYLKSVCARLPPGMAAPLPVGTSRLSAASNVSRYGVQLNKPLVVREKAGKLFVVHLKNNVDT